MTSDAAEVVREEERPKIREDDCWRTGEIDCFTSDELLAWLWVHSAGMGGRGREPPTTI